MSYLTDGAPQLFHDNDSRGPLARALRDVGQAIIGGGVSQFGNPGNERFVNSATGNDNNDGLTWSSAKRTFLGAYDSLSTNGGTIYLGANTIVGGEVSHQGIWLMGGLDPNSASPPPGWRKVKPLHVVGRGGQIGLFVTEPGSILLGGPEGAWENNKLKPAIWIAGSTVPILFEGVIVRDNALARPVVLGIASDRGTADAFVANLTFRSCGFAMAGIPSVGRGPSVEVAHIFWTRFDRCGFTGFGPFALADPSENLSLHQAGSAIATNLKSGSSCGLEVRDSISQFGGIHYDVGGTTWGFMIENFAVESDFVNPTNAAVYVNNSTSVVGQGFIKGAALADLTNGSEPTVLIRPMTADPNCVHVENTDVIDGPAILHTSMPSYGLTKTPAGSRQVALYNGRFVGRWEGLNRSGAPTALRVANMVTAFPPVSTANVVITPGAPDPWGGNTAVGVTVGTSYTDALMLAQFSKTVAVGDQVLAGAWIRSPNGVANFVAPTLVITTGSSNNKFNNAASYAVSNAGSRGDGEWIWNVVQAQYTTVVDQNVNVAASINSNVDHPFYAAGPVVLFFPAGTISDNDFQEVALALSTAPISARPGMLHPPPGIPLAISNRVIQVAAAAPGSGTWLQGDRVFNSAPAVGQPQGWVCTVGGSPGTWVSMGNL